MSHLEQQLYFSLGERDQRIFTIHDVVALLHISEYHARNLTSDMVTKRAIERVKPGLYARVPESVILDKKLYTEDAILIAAKAAPTAFLSYYTALGLHGLAERFSTRVYVTGPTHQRDITYHEVHITFIKVTQQRFFGITTLGYAHDTVHVSDRERTILDCIARPQYAGGWSECIHCLQNLDDLEWDRLLSYLKRFGNKVLARRCGYLLSSLDNLKLPKTVKKAILGFSGTNFYYFIGLQKGTLDREWNLIVPSYITEALHANPAHK